MPKEFDPDVSAFIRQNLPAVLPPTLTLKEQAQKIGVSDATLSDVLSGEARVGKKTLPVFAKALGLTVEDLVKQARSGRHGYQVARASLKSPLVRVADAGNEPRVAVFDGGVSPDTLSMADEAARDLSELDRVPAARAWQLMRGIRLNKPTARGYYVEARRKLKGAEGSAKGPVEYEAELERPSGPPKKDRKRP